MVNILFADRALSFLTAAFFVVHPVHTTAVSYISSRAESLYLVFMLAAFIVYIRSVRHDKGPVSYVVMLACYSIALLSKENALILPALILVYHIAFREKIRPGQFLSVTSLAVIYIFMRLTVLGHLISGAAPVSALVQRIPGFFIAIFTYARLLFLPLGLHIEYGAPLFGITDPRAITGFVILAALIFCALKTRRTNKLVFFSLSWFLVSIAPVSNLYPLNAYMSENWLYLPSIGFFIILAGFFRSLYSKDAFRVPAVILAACLLASYSYLTFRQNQTWQSHIKFCERTLRYAPGSSKVSINLGILYYLTGRKEDAASMFKKTIEIDPHSAEAYDSLGSVYYNTDRKEDAITMYRKAAELNPDYAPAFTNLAGALYYDAGKKEEAIGFYKRVIELKPDSAEACYNLAAAYFNMGGAKEGLYYCRKALEIDPNYEVARASLAKIEAAIKEQAPAPEEGGENKQPAP
jgi:tetratricopeptide (TPR) repeat protein